MHTRNSEGNSCEPRIWSLESLTVRKQVRIWTRIVVLLLVLGFGSSLSYARAGGGGGFSGGGFRGGGGFSGGFHGGGSLHSYHGSSGGGEVSLPVLLAVIVVILMLAYISRRFSDRRNSTMSNSIKKAYAVQNSRRQQEVEAEIRRLDPDFSKENLTERVWQAFRQLQLAWSNQDMKPVRHFVSDGIFERFSLQIDMQKACRIQNRMSDIEIRNVRVAMMETDGCFDTVHFQITARASDCFIDLETGKTVSGNLNDLGIFTEYWSFLRRRGTKTLAKPSLFEGHCPNCGEKLDIVDVVECPSCKALVNSGDYDWVLSEITQVSEWCIKPRRSIPGLESLMKQDPDFHIQHIEDRVSCMFYRQIAARFFADSSYMIKLAADSFLGQNNNLYQPLPDGTHRFPADAAVGAVEVVEIILAETPDPYDRLRVKIKWMGHELTAKVPSLIVPDFEASHLFQHEFILIRKAGATSSSRNVLASVHCPNCGAPETRSPKSHCEYCGTPLNDGFRDWVLSEIRRFSGYPEPVGGTRFDCMKLGESDREDAVGPVLSEFDNENLIASMAVVMLADGVIDPREKEMLSDFARIKGVSSQRLNAVLNSVTHGHFEIPRPETVDAARVFVRNLVRMCLVDGKVSEEEEKLLQKLVGKMGYTTWDVRMIINQERARLYRHAKQVIAKSPAKS